jgi:pilus assembly protein CpaB
MGIWKAILPIILAVFIAVIGGVFTYNWVKRQIGPQKVVPEKETVMIASAAIDLPWGTKINKDQLKLVPYLKETLPPGYFSDLNKLENRVVVLPIKANEPVLETKLAPASITAGGISAVVKTGKRAIAVKGDKVIGLAGLINAGNVVDVMVTIEDPRDKKKITKLVLENIPVLATGSQVEKNAKGEPSPVDVFTLEVSPEEGEKLALAATEGKLQLALRNAMDTEVVLTNGATIPETLESYSGKVVKVSGQDKKVQSYSRREPVTVKEIRGTKVSTQGF